MLEELKELFKAEPEYQALLEAELGIHIELGQNGIEVTDVSEKVQ